MPESRHYDIRNYFKTSEDRAAYLEAILEEGDPTLIAAGMGEIAKAMGVSESLGKAASAGRRSTKDLSLAETRRSRRSQR